MHFALNRLARQETKLPTKRHYLHSKLLAAMALTLAITAPLLAQLPPHHINDFTGTVRTQQGGTVNGTLVDWQGATIRRPRSIFAFLTTRQWRLTREPRSDLPTISPATNHDLHYHAASVCYYCRPGDVDGHGI
jgi:hypothetical protein